MANDGEPENRAPRELMASAIWRSGAVLLRCSRVTAGLDEVSGGGEGRSGRLTSPRRSGRGAGAGRAGDYKSTLSRRAGRTSSLVQWQRPVASGRDRRLPRLSVPILATRLSVSIPARSSVHAIGCGLPNGGDFI